MRRLLRDADQSFPEVAARGVNCEPLLASFYIQTADPSLPLALPPHHGGASTAGLLAEERVPSSDRGRAMNTAIPLDPDRTAGLARLWTRATGHAAERPIHCAACGAEHERDCLLRIISPSRDLVAALCDPCAQPASYDLDGVEDRIDGRGRAGYLCAHLFTDSAGNGLLVADADCGCGIGGAA
jgi:hypothetical protein